MIRPFVLCACLLLPGLAAAQGVKLGTPQGNSKEPVQITSNQLEVNQTAGTALFTGDVVVIQGDTRIGAPRILVEYVKAPDGTVTSTVDKITATGGVTMATPTEAAESSKAVYTPQNDMVTMTGDVLLTQGPNTLTGNQLVFNITTGVGQMDGRVRSVITPGSSGTTQQ